MSALEWVWVPRKAVSEAHDQAWRRYYARIGTNPSALLLQRDGDSGDWVASYTPIDFEMYLPGDNLTDAEAQALAVPTLVRALRAVLEKLEET